MRQAEFLTEDQKTRGIHLLPFFEVELGGLFLAEIEVFADAFREFQEKR